MDLFSRNDLALTQHFNWIEKCFGQLWRRRKIHPTFWSNSRRIRCVVTLKSSIIVKCLHGLHWYRFVTRLSSHSLDSTCLSSTLFGSIPANFWPASKGTEENLCSCHIITISLPLKTSSRNGEGREGGRRKEYNDLVVASSHAQTLGAGVGAGTYNLKYPDTLLRQGHC